jgi:hypothetical protein
VRWLIASLFVLSAGSSASADDDGVIAISIEAGQKVKKPVGNANGWFCDVPALVKADIVTEGETNYWVVEGRQMGRTTCRVGTDPTRAVFIFDITVTRPTKPTSKPRR